MQFGIARSSFFAGLAGALAALLCAAPEAAGQSAISRAVDRLNSLQADITGDNARNGTPDSDPNDGGWDYDIQLSATQHSINQSPDDTYGVTAFGLIRAWKRVGRSPRVVIAISDAASGMLARPEVDTGLDFAFLNLTGGLLADPSYKPESRARWDAKLSSLGGPQALAQSIVSGRAAAGEDGLIPWDINQWVMSAFFMEKSFPGQGYRQQGQIMAQAIFNDLYSVTPIFDKDDPSEPYYHLGLMGAHLAFRLTRQFEAEAEVLRFNLVSRQDPSGWWSINASFPGPHVQTTAWVATSLYLFGNNPSYFAAGQAASNYLATAQDANGGWNLGGNSENTEVDGEAILALALFPPSSFMGTDVSPPEMQAPGLPVARPFAVR